MAKKETVITLRQSECEKIVNLVSRAEEEGVEDYQITVRRNGNKGIITILGQCMTEYSQQADIEYGVK
jgi:hypothetical protein